MASARHAGTNESKWTGSQWQAGVNTFGGVGYGRDYTSLNGWCTDTDVDLVTAQVCPVLECYDDEASYTLSGTTYIQSATTSATYHRIVRAASTARHGGIPGSGVVFYSTSGGLSIAEAHVHLYDLEFEREGNSVSSITGLSALASTNYGTIVGVIVKCTNVTDTAYGFRLASGNYWNFIDCIAYQCTSAGFYLDNYGGYVYNCTSVDNIENGFLSSTYHPVYKNCIAYGNTDTDWYGTFDTSGTTHNLSGDATAPAMGTYYRNKSLTFANAGAGNYSLVVATDGDAIDKGTDLSADGNYPFNDDIAYTTITGTWDLGAFAYNSGTTYSGKAYGVQTPEDIEEASSWQLCTTSTGGAVTVTGDSAWGTLTVNDGTPVVTPVLDTGNTNSKTIRCTVGKYATGTGTVTVAVRGQASSFSATDASPSWTTYSGPTSQTWQYIQAKLTYASS